MRGPARRAGALALAAAAALAAVFLSPAAAVAAFDLTSFSAEPASDAAGAYTDFSVSFDVQEPEADLRDLTIHLPPGEVGNPLAAPTCTEAQLNDDDCPPASDVGDASNEVSFGLPVPVSTTVTGQVYNVVPRAGEPARFGIVLKAGPPGFEPIVLQLPARLRSGDFGLDTVLEDIPNQATVGGLQVGIDVERVELTLEGQVGSPPQGFLRNPTSCGSHAVRFDARAHDDQTANGGTSFNTVNCAALPFSPELSGTIGAPEAPGGPVPVSTTISQSVEEAGLKRTQVTLPEGLMGNAARLGDTCSAADFEAGTCPADSIVGDATASSPFQPDPLGGPVVLVANPTGLPDIGVDLQGALSLQLRGTISLTPELRSRVVFAGLPDIPISAFTLALDGPPDGLNLATRDPCAPPPLIFDVSFLAHSDASVEASPEATIVGCPPPPTVPPTGTLKLRKLRSGEPALKVAAEAGTTPLKSATLRLPHGLRFGFGRDFKRGCSIEADGDVLARRRITHARRSLTAKGRRNGADELLLRCRGGAVRAKESAGPKRELELELRLRDAAGELTTLTLSPE